MEMHADQQVLHRRDVPKQPDVLIGAADPGGGDAIGREAVDALAAKPDLPGGNLQVLHDAVEDRRLAGAVRADDAVDGALADVQIEFVDREKTAEAHRQPLRRQDRFRRGRHLRLCVLQV